MDVTACLWSSELDDFDALYTWASIWQGTTPLPSMYSTLLYLLAVGPISLLMTTAVAPDSGAHISLLKRIHYLNSHLSIPMLSLHLLHLAHEDQASPNTYINIARLFAVTKTVMLVPANLSLPPLITSDAVGIQKSRLRLVTPSGQIRPTFSTLPSLSSLILPLNHPVWCTDRFFVDNTRASDWRECLWQYWLDSFGEFNNIEATITVRHKQEYDPEVNPGVSFQYDNPYVSC